jgi:hypothetical protein
MLWILMIVGGLRAAASLVADAGRSEGSNRGKPIIDWSRAFEFYVALSDEHRSYQAVAHEFGVSVRTVESHGREEQWVERLRAIKQKAAEDAVTLLAASGVKRIMSRLRLAEATFGAYAAKLANGEVRITPADLERLHRFCRQLIEELELEAGIGRPPPPAVNGDRSPEHVAAVVAALAETGALEALGLYLNDNPATSAEYGDLDSAPPGTVPGSDPGGLPDWATPSNPYYNPRTGREEHRAL